MSGALLVRKRRNTRAEQRRAELAGKQSGVPGYEESEGSRGRLSGSAVLVCRLQPPYLGLVALLSHQLGLLLQQGAGQLLCLPRLFLFLLLLPVRFPGLQLALGNLDTKSKVTLDKAQGLW